MILIFLQVKRDMDKGTSDTAIVAKERNDAVSQVENQLKEIERLESDRRDLFARIDVLERQRNGQKDTADTRNTMGDFNMKLKLEMGNLRAENDKLLKAKDEIAKEKSEMNEKFVSTKILCKNAQDELKQTNSKLSESG